MIENQMTESNRELLELAAKAAGLKDIEYYSYEPGKPWPPIECIKHHIDNEPMPQYWNPLVDDGDALRLAVELDMIISVNRVDGYTEVSGGYSNADLVSVKKNHDDDIYKATRRAIICVAAEIGRAMP